MNNQSIITWYSACFEVIYDVLDVLWCIVLCFDVFIITNENSIFLYLVSSRFFNPHWEKHIVTKNQEIWTS